MRFRITSIASVFVISLLAGCAATTKVVDPVTPITSKIADPLSAQLEFWHGLADRRIVCNDDAFHGLLLYLDEKDPSTDYAQRVATLKSRRLIPGYFNGAGDDAVDRGTIAYAIVQALHVQGGWVMTVFGPSPRYAVRELMDMNLYPRSSPEQSFSGRDFVGIIARVEDYQDGESAFIPAQTMHGEPPGD